MTASLHILNRPRRARVRPAKGRPLRAFLDQAAREYRDKVVERVLRRPLRKPWMKYRESAIVEELLAALRPASALEWGVGYGTLCFPRRLPPGSHWISVEHDPEWADRIRALTDSGRVRVYTVLPEPSGWEQATEAAAGKPLGGATPAGDGSYEDFRRYVEFPARFGEFDFILVDGRARNACLRRAHGLLSPGGVVVLHDANRAFLRAAWELYPRQAVFRDYRDYSGGLWIGSKGRDLGTLLDLRKHRQVWRMYNTLGRRFRL